jgi:membrane-associated protease RseP (regulator of RpoE activity)
MTDESNDNSEESDQSGISRVQSLEPPQLLPKRIPVIFVLIGIAAFFAIVLLAGGGLYDLFLILSVIVGLSLIVMMHEGAHFLVGKKCGMKITEFFVGFGSRIWSTQRGETEYGVKAIPAGGYVRIIGMTNIEHVPAEDEPRTYRAQTYPRRVATTFAGIASHFILAFFLAIGVISLYGEPDKATLTVDQVIKLKPVKSPAELAGFRHGDKIISYDGITPKTWIQFRKYVGKHRDKTMHVVVRRNDKLISLRLTPIDNAIAYKEEPAIPGQSKGKITHTGYIGLVSKPSYKGVSVVATPVHAAQDVWYKSDQIVRAVGGLFSPTGAREMYRQIIDDPNANDNYRLSSPVGITRIAGQAAQHGFKDVLSLLFIINLSLGIFNFIPLLPLDGGHIAIATYERFRSRNGKRYVVDIRKIAPVAYFVAGFLIIVSLASVYLDIARPLPSPFH